MQSLKDPLLSEWFDVLKLLVQLKLELIDLSFEIGEKGPLRAMLDLLG